MSYVDQIQRVQSYLAIHTNNGRATGSKIKKGIGYNPDLDKMVRDGHLRHPVVEGQTMNNQYELVTVAA